jgi:hypothetical protein
MEGRVSPCYDFQTSGAAVFTEESCILRLRQILARLFAQIHFEFAIVLEGLHKIFAWKLNLYRLTEWQMHSRLEDHNKYPHCNSLVSGAQQQNKTQANMKREDGSSKIRIQITHSADQ